MSKILNFIGKSPDDPEVLEAKKNHKDFLSPLGEHIYINGGYRIVVPDSVFESYQETLKQPFVSGCLPSGMISQSRFNKLKGVKDEN